MGIAARNRAPHFAERRAADPAYRFVSTDTLKLYVPRSGVAVPPALAGLAPGVHDEVRTPEGMFVVLVNASDQGGGMLALDISNIERRERTLTLSMLLPTAAVAALLAFLTYVGVGWLVRPLSSMAKTIASWPPNRSGQRLRIEASAPHEAEVVAVALNGYLRRIDTFVERECAFVNMARVCEHLGWSLSFSSKPGKGTRAVLDLTSGTVLPVLQDSDSRPPRMEGAAVVNRTEGT